MTELSEYANHVAKRAINMARVVIDLERHLLAEQADAIKAPRDHLAYLPKSAEIDEDDPEAGPPVDLGHSDPTTLMANRLGPFRSKYRMMFGAVKSLDKAMDGVEYVVARVMSMDDDEPPVDEPRCPGWNVELRARLGGCGKILETYKRNDQTTGERSLCSSCRKAEGIERRRAEADAA